MGPSVIAAEGRQGIACAQIDAQIVLVHRITSLREKDRPQSPLLLIVDADGDEIVDGDVRRQRHLDVDIMGRQSPQTGSFATFDDDCHIPADPASGIKRQKAFAQRDGPATSLLGDLRTRPVGEGGRRRSTAGGKGKDVKPA
jgi:hypothetical protein